MIGNNIWQPDVREKILHVYAQEIYHGDAVIVGSNDALRRLGNALIDASKKGQGAETQVSMVCSDGEGYRVRIRPMSDQQIETSPMPYAQLGQSWEFERCHDCPHDNAPEASQ